VLSFPVASRLIIHQIHLCFCRSLWRSWPRAVLAAQHLITTAALALQAQPWHKELQQQQQLEAAIWVESGTQQHKNNNDNHLTYGAALEVVSCTSHNFYLALSLSRAELCEQQQNQTMDPFQLGLVTHPEHLPWKPACLLHMANQTHDTKPNA
jgi:hypothetical protein